MPPKRLHLLWVFCVSLLGVLSFSLFLRVIFASFGQQPSFFQMAYLSLVMICCIISLPYLALFTLWAFVRLVFNLPAVTLTPEGIINHSIVYHVVIPWREIDVLERDLAIAPPTSSRSPRRRRRQGKLIDSDILVLGHDQRRLYEQQQPLTRALLWLFKPLRPININTDVIAWSREEVWAQLERYVRETLGNTTITLSTLQPKPASRL